ncbi:bifunctional folylpolyglutamate synthase/dihydrofolate synthase [Catalinimonas niigatensis]|uniref:bifunctional folylpolyglutamate synthase/dihydrofolate synthase n=1 Tax=Catalinimonas niigatensis TaxID=1397264 RepID=UPI0026662950|nr:folylpolyglutamate synthase/dihydrofolate synthase family protein [Catalinimonas niigatensis]WPP49834.1 folylpolyglutamate synthase/dihydrofolate synthase family protein [Catalinimonas niigatensis]
MNYQQAIQYLYDALPMFQRIGKSAFKKDLTNTLSFCAHLQNPQNTFATVHVAGTNGKGSSAHSIAAILQAAGYKTGLYTSPHLKSFTERIRINGHPIDEESVIRFVQNHKDFMESLKPSFFETTVAMAFDYFRQEQVDIAVIEVGMGGRLDSTNVIQPLLSLITHISMDHTDFLGDTLEKIAVEKAGIIKQKTPVIIGEKQTATVNVFTEIAQRRQASLSFASDDYQVSIARVIDGKYTVNVEKEGQLVFGDLALSLGAHYQLKNLPGILKSVDILIEKGFNITAENIRYALGAVSELTSLKGRWQILSKKPLIICDTGHNKGAFEEIGLQLRHIHYRKLYVVLGVNEEKEPQHLLPFLPPDAYYLFCQADIPRAMPVDTLAKLALESGFQGEVHTSVSKAYQKAKALAQADDCIFVGGSTFVVAEIEDLS